MSKGKNKKKKNNYKNRDEFSKNKNFRDYQDNNKEQDLEEENRSDITKIVEDSQEFDKDFNIDLAIEKENEENKDEAELSTSTKVDFNVNDSSIKKVKVKRHVFVHLLLIVLLLVSLVFFGVHIYDKESSVVSLISSLLLTLFTVLFVVTGISYRRKSKSLLLLASCLLILYFGVSINSTLSLFRTPLSTIEDFSGKSLVDVVSWAEKNDITLNQEYEYSDMVPEYNIISQELKSGTKMGDIKELTVSVSEGPNPSKEIIVPSMTGWDSDRVINFVKDNYLSKVNVEFVESEKAANTVIEQDKSGTVKRDDEIKLTFSYGEELGFEEVALVDFKGMSKFEVEFYMKQHQLKYSLSEDFSNKVKRGLAVKQSIKPGEQVKINDEEVKVTISKGKKIKVPNLKEYSMTEITEWAVKNKVKLQFSDKYDDTVKENHVISANYDKGEVIEQGCVVKVVISRGSLKMPKFKSFSAFREWADKYGIKYEEKHEFSDDIEAGEVISYSYKTGETIKNDDTIIVKISDGKKKEVPKLEGLTKKEAMEKLDKLGLKYNFIYKASDSVSKNKVISQSISAGSDISSGTTITITLSNGKKEVSESKESTTQNRVSSSGSKKNNSSSNSSSGNSGGNSNHSGGSNKVEPTCHQCTITSLRPVYLNNMGNYEAVAGALRSHIQGQCPGIKVNIIGDPTADGTPGSPVSGFSGGEANSCGSVTITIAK